MPNNYGRSVWDIGQLYKAQDVGMRIPFASLLAPAGDQPAQPLPSTMQWREGVPFPTGQAQTAPVARGQRKTAADIPWTGMPMVAAGAPLGKAASFIAGALGGLPETIRSGVTAARDVWQGTWIRGARKASGGLWIWPA